MHEAEVKKELKTIKDKLPKGLSVMLDNGYIYFYEKNKRVAKISFDKNYNMFIRTDKGIQKL